MLRCIKELHLLAVLIEEILAEFQGVEQRFLPMDTISVLQGVIEAFFNDIMEGMR
jgi:hypothetical protein